MRISIITPFYEGNAYMEAYQESLCHNEAALSAYNAKEGTSHELEIILVNDSPKTAPRLQGVNAGKRNWKILANKKNMGIHPSRVAGLMASSGDYILFLDQDDVLADDAVVTFIQEVDRLRGDQEFLYKVLISNALLEERNGSVLWIRTPEHEQLVWDLATYLTVGTQIISPGQVLLYRGLIPEEWLTNLCHKNGADDYFLWLLLLERGVPGEYINKPLYIHGYHGDNLSSDTTVTDASSYEFISYLRKMPDIPGEDVDTLEKMITYKAAFRRENFFGKISLSLQNFGLLIKNIRFKRRTKTHYGFHRE